MAMKASEASKGLRSSPPAVIDAHVHCGVIDQSPPQSFEDYTQKLPGTDVRGAALFSPVIEIYDRHDPRFIDTPAWRSRRRDSNAYLLTLRPHDFAVYPYFFIWNDFAVDQLTPAHCGIKWHRHSQEPVYHYDDPGCRAALSEIRRRNLPVVLEEEFYNTLYFVRELARVVRVIIPHLGMLNGGFEALVRAGLWEEEHVWADTALASREEIRAYIRRYGHSRLLFGSDFPFGSPGAELSKVRGLGLDPEAEAAILGGNFRRLQADVQEGF